MYTRRSPKVRSRCPICGTNLGWLRAVVRAPNWRKSICQVDVIPRRKIRRYPLPWSHGQQRRCQVIIHLKRAQSSAMPPSVRRSSG